jgi:hypothetical protein
MKIIVEIGDLNLPQIKEVMIDAIEKIFDPDVDTLMDGSISLVNDAFLSVEEQE